MSMAGVVGLGILVWIPLSILLALLVGRTIHLREQQYPGQGPPVQRSQSDRAGASAPWQRSWPGPPGEP